MKVIKQSYFGKIVKFIRPDRFVEARVKALKRDSYTCQYCGAKDKKLLVHHKDLSGDNYYYHTVNNELSNLITLCYKCHHKAHSLIHKLIGRGYVHA
jgi:5-methylcytosine-specific restriction endonuclease McrA